MRKKLSRLFQWLYKGVPVVKVLPIITPVLDKEKLKGRRIVILGGSRGVGASIAQKCQECGAEILIVGRDSDTLRMASVSMGNCKTMSFDVRDIHDYDDLLIRFEGILAGPIDSLVYCASLYLHETSIMDVTPDGFDSQFSINLRAPYFLSKAFIKYVESRSIPAANLLMVSSEMGLYCSDIPYGLSKASLCSLVEGMGRRCLKQGIRVNGLAPGVMAHEVANSSEDLFNKYSCGQRLILPEEVAEVAAFLLSDASSCIVGTVIPCNFGNHYRCDW